MPELPSFTVAGKLYDAPGIVIAGELTRQALAKARVMFTSNLIPDSFVIFDGDLHRPPVKVIATVDDDAALIDRDGFPLKLLANDPGLSVTGIQWKVSVLLPVPGPLQEIKLGPFDARSDGEVLDLADITPTLELPPMNTGGVFIIDGTPE